MSTERLSSLAVRSWYQDHARPLPWRESGTSAYGVLVSEVMSQQTPVARVEPAWREWMRRWPDPCALANANVGEVLKVWGRLGYPRRALRLIEAARTVVAEYAGRLPTSLDDLLALPGVGSYTAGAVVAFAYGRRALTLDTNVRRVLARAAAGQALPPPSPSRAERELADSLLPARDEEAAQWSAAVMELGALVCTAASPVCQECPWKGVCAWRAAGYPPDKHAGRRRAQAWHGTDRQARGLVMAALRDVETGHAVGRARLLEAAGRAGAGRAGTVRGGAGGDQAQRALAGLLADGLIVTDDSGATFRLP